MDGIYGMGLENFPHRSSLSHPGGLTTNDVARHYLLHSVVVHSGDVNSAFGRYNSWLSEEPKSGA